MTLSFIITTLTDQGVQKKSDLGRINSHCARTRAVRRWSDVVAQRALIKSRLDENCSEDENESPTSRFKSVTSTLFKKRGIGAANTSKSIRGICTESVEDTSEFETTDLFHNGLSLPPALDALFRLAIEANAREKNLIKFWLLRGRRFTSPTRSEPKYCPDLATATMLAESPIYVSTLIILSELLQSALSGHSVQLTSNTYKHRGHAYQAMSKMVDDPNISIYVKLVSLCNLGTIESTFSRCDLQAKHLEALSTCIDLYGGAAKLEPRNLYQAQQLRFLYRSLWINIPCFMLQNNALATPHAFESSLAEFLKALREIGDWTAGIVFETSFKNPTVHVAEYEVEDEFSDTACPSSTPTLTSLRTYLHWLIDSYLMKDVPLAERTFALQTLEHLFDLCRLQVDYSYTASQSLQLLRAVEQYMIKSTDPKPLGKSSKPQMPNETVQRDHLSTNVPIRLHPVLAMDIVLEVRDDIVPSRPEVEFEAVKFYSRVFKLVPFLSRQTAVRLGRSLTACALGVVCANSNSIGAPTELLQTFDEEQLGAIEQELRWNWLSAHAGTTSSSHSDLKGQPIDRLELFTTSWVNSFQR